MRRLVCASLFAATLAACTTKISLPVVGRNSDGEAMQGTATASLGDTPGSFTVFSASGMRCSGTYDDTTTDTTLVIPVKCDDGRKGTVISTRDSTLVRGTAVATLDDGTTAEFIFGNISAQDQAAFLAKPAPSPIKPRE